MLVRLVVYTQLPVSESLTTHSFLLVRSGVYTELPVSDVCSYSLFSAGSPDKCHGRQVVELAAIGESGPVHSISQGCFFLNAGTCLLLFYSVLTLDRWLFKH